MSLALVVPLLALGQAAQPACTTIAQCAALIADLQAQIAALQAGQGASQTPPLPQATPFIPPPFTPNGCPAPTQNLSFGDSGSGVSNLQQFLKQQGVSIYPEGLVTGFFGPATERAVERFQVRYVIIPGGTPETTGYGVVGPHTRAKIAELCGVNSTGLSQTVSSPETTSAASGQAIEITSVSPASGPVGTTMEIRGRGFSASNNTLSVLLPTGFTAVVPNIASLENGTLIRFTIPETIGGFRVNPSSFYRFGITNVASQNSNVVRFAVTEPGTTSTTETTSSIPSSLSTKFSIGDRVVTISTLNVRASSAADAPLLGTVPTGTLGTVVAGPVSSGGYIRWQVRYDNPALTAWSAENWLIKPTAAVTTSSTTGNASASGITTTQATITWPASGSANSSYACVWPSAGSYAARQCYGTRGGNQAGTSGSNTYTNLQPGTAYSYEVKGTVCPTPGGTGCGYDYPIASGSFTTLAAADTVNTGATSNADLAAYNVITGGTPLANQSFNLQFVIKNIGAAASVASVGNYKIGNSAAGDFNVPALAAGATHSLQRTFSLLAGTYIVRLCANAGASGSIAPESNTANNCIDRAMTVASSTTVMNTGTVSVTSIVPSSGPAGTPAVINGSGFTQTGNTVIVYRPNLTEWKRFTNVESAKSDGTAITFPIPTDIPYDSQTTNRFYFQVVSGNGVASLGTVYAFTVTQGTQTTTVNVVGYVGPVTSSKVYGWACVPGSAAQLPVTVYFNGANPTLSTANRARTEPGFTTSSGCPDTLHGFEVTPPTLPAGTYTVTATAQNPATGAAVSLTPLSGQTTLTVAAPVATLNISSINPAAPMLGSTVTVLGTGFSPAGNSASLFYPIEGTRVVSGIASSNNGTTLQFTLPAGTYDTRNFYLGITNAGGQTSNTFVFQVTSGGSAVVTPSVSGISPASNTVTAGQPTTFTISGTNFKSDAVIVYSGSSSGTIPPTSVSPGPSSQLQFYASGGLAAGTYSFYVRNVADNQTSNAWSYGINPAAPSLSVIFNSPNPATITSGQSATLSWTISGAVSCSISPTVGAITPASGQVSVSPTTNTLYTLTCTSSTGAQTSGSQTVSVTAPSVAPAAISGITPSSAPIGTTVTVNGSGFSATNNTVRVYGPDPATFQLVATYTGVPSTNNGTAIQLTVPASFSGPAGVIAVSPPQTYRITVTNSNQVTSNLYPFYVTSGGSAAANTPATVARTSPTLQLASAVVAVMTIFGEVVLKILGISI